ncbi:MAG: IS30 family transposase [bacterium]|nr:IS30 family transposase [bacterium]
MKEVAKAIGVVASAVWYELKTFTRKGRAYNAAYAHHRAYVKRKYARAQGRTIALHPKLKKTVEAYLMDDQSPEHVAERIKRYHKDLPHISGRLIRRYIASPYGRRIESHRAKVFKKKHRGGRKKTFLDGKRMISKRPLYINTRKRIGDAEGDFIVSGRGGSGIILNITDRKGRAPFFEKIYPVSIRSVERAIGRIKKRFPELKTLTLDNDILFLHHKRLEKKFGIRIFFCYPGRPYEKGANENRNKIVRRYIRKGSDISKIPRSRIRALEEKLQRQIMKCLNYRTPGEILARHRKKKKAR